MLGAPLVKWGATSKKACFEEFKKASTTSDLRRADSGDFMIQMETVLKAGDNSGAKEVKCSEFADVLIKNL